MKHILVAYDGGEPAHRALEMGDRPGHQRFDAIAGESSASSRVHPGRAPFDPWDDRAGPRRTAREAREVLASHGVVAGRAER